MQKNNENDFELSVNKSLKKSKLRASSLYNTSEILVETKSVIFKDLKVKQVENSNKQVFYIELDKPPYQNLIKDYNFKESHLTIHKYYRENLNHKNGLTAAHYTETYLHTSENQEVVIHVYFDCHGYYRHTQIKEYKGNRAEGKYTELALDANLEELLKTNVQQAKSILGDILDANEDLRDKLIVQADMQEKTLQEISKKLEKNSIELYIKTGKDFIQTIELLNKHLDGNYDKRDEVVARQLQFLEENAQKNNNDEQVTSTVSVTPGTSSPKNSVDVSSTKLENNSSVYREIESLEAQLRGLKKSLNQSAQNISLLIKKDELIKTIQLKLLQHSSVLSTARGPLKNTLNNLRSLLSDNKTLFEIFEKEFWKGNVDLVRQIYPSIEHKITLEYALHQLLVKLIHTVPKNKEQEMKLKTVFDYLNETSSLYRILISSRGTLLFRVTHTNLFYSLLVAACQEENLFAFKLLMEHGMSPNNIGALVSDIHVPAMYFIVADPKPEKLIYLEEALKYGGQYLCELKPLSLDKKSMRSFNGPNGNSRILAMLDKKNCGDQLLYATLLECKNVIDWCCKLGNTQAIQLFIPQLKLEDILHSLSSQTIQKKISRRHIIPGPELGCYAANSKEEANRMSVDLLSKGYEQALMTIIFYPNRDDSPIKLIEQLLRLLKEKVAYYSKTAPNELKKLFEKLYDRAKTLRFSPPKSLTGVWEFDACLLLLLLEPNPTVMTIQTIMQLYCYQASCVRDNYKEQNDRYIEFYYLAMELATTTQFKEQLMTTPVFGHVFKIVSKIVKEINSALEDENDKEEVVQKP